MILVGKSTKICWEKFIETEKRDFFFNIKNIYKKAENLVTRHTRIIRWKFKWYGLIYMCIDILNFDLGHNIQNSCNVNFALKLQKLDHLT